MNEGAEHDLRAIVRALQQIDDSANRWAEIALLAAIAVALIGCGITALIGSATLHYGGYIALAANPSMPASVAYRITEQIGYGQMFAGVGSTLSFSGVGTAIWTYRRWRKLMPLTAHGPNPAQRPRSSSG